MLRNYCSIKDKKYDICITTSIFLISAEIKLDWYSIAISLSNEKLFY